MVDYSNILVLCGQTAFFRFSLGWRKKGSSGLQSLLVLVPPAVVGGVNGGNVIYYCLIVTHAISVVLYKRVSLHIKALG